MIGQLDLDSRADLCRQLAKREPANRLPRVAEAKGSHAVERESAGRYGSTLGVRNGKDPRQLIFICNPNLLSPSEVSFNVR